GRSSFNLKSLFNLAMSGLTGFSDLPLRVCIYLGAILALGAMSYGVWIIIKTLIEGISIPGWATLAAGMTLLGGIQLLFIGILGEYIGRIYAEVKNRPKYIISTEHPRTKLEHSITHHETTFSSFYCFLIFFR
ncbi:hypothetical protein RZN38_28990, partial [Klebsiella pneumoniae]|nr:hypothetical protein [Klebsiella pneumoniae]